MAQDLGVTVERDGPVATIVFEDVQLKLDVLTRMARTLYQLESDPSVEAIVITGRRNVFMSGAELKEFDQLTNAELAEKFIEIPRLLMARIADCSKVVVAAINGYCIGGGLELALACDFRICVDRVINANGEPVPFLGLPEVSLGVVPPLGSSFFLPRIVGLAHAKAIMLTADLLDAHEALRMGLVHSIVSREALAEEALRWVRRVTKNSLFAVKSAKRLLNRSHDRDSLADALLAEQTAFAACCESPDKAERIGAKVRRRSTTRPAARPAPARVSARTSARTSAPGQAPIACGASGPRRTERE
jgi:enoyl-CoA hydratase/carnithine racemase